MHSNFIFVVVIHWLKFWVAFRCKLSFIQYKIISWILDRKNASIWYDKVIAWNLCLQTLKSIFAWTWDDHISLLMIHFVVSTHLSISLECNFPIIDVIMDYAIRKWLYFTINSNPTGISHIFCWMSIQIDSRSLWKFSR